MSSLLNTFTVLFFACLFFGQATPCGPRISTAEVVRFLAPPYPRAAKDNRIIGTTVSEVSVAGDGSISDVRTVRAHPVFETYVKDALKQWRFRPTVHEYKLKVSIIFAFDEACEGTDKDPITSETHVSADLPTAVHVVTGLKCLELHSNAIKNADSPGL
jgi:TonB family protein